jgi:hypothetical protein
MQEVFRGGVVVALCFGDLTLHLIYRKVVINGGIHGDRLLWLALVGFHVSSQRQVLVLAIANCYLIWEPECWRDRHASACGAVMYQLLANADIWFDPYDWGVNVFADVSTSVLKAYFSVPKDGYRLAADMPLRRDARLARWPHCKP